MRFVGLLVFALAVAAFPLELNAQAPPSSARKIDGLLSVPEHRSELSKLKAAVETVLADARLSDPPTREMLRESKAALSEMLDQKTGADARKLLSLADWMRSQGAARIELLKAEAKPTDGHRFILDNPLAGSETYLVSLLGDILGTSLQNDGEKAGAANLNALLQLCLKHGETLEGRSGIVDAFLWRAPQWLQANYTEIPAEQRRQFLKDLKTAREVRALGPDADQVAGDPPTAQELAAYQAAYQFVVANTP